MRDHLYRQHAMNSDNFTACVWTDDTMLKLLQAEFPPRVVKCYQMINPQYGPARADLFRYCVVYARGGFWFDAKSAAHIPLDELLEKSQEGKKAPLFLVNWKGMNGQSLLDARGEICNWFFGAKRQHPLLWKVIEGVCMNIEMYEQAWVARVRNGESTNDMTGKSAVLEVTGPLAWSRILYSHLHNHQHHFNSDPHGELGLVLDFMRNFAGKLWRPFHLNYPPCFVELSSNVC